SIAVIMNLSPNHLDRYPGFEAYAEAKMRILNNMNELDLLIYNADDPLLCQRIEEVKPQKIPFSIQQTNFETGAYWKDNNIYIHWKNMDSCIPMPHPHLRGPHNRYNMLVAALIAAIWNIPIKTIRETIENFPGIEHRLENSGIIDGVKYVNDSKATSVDSLRWALQSFDEKIVLIAGGKDKGGEYSEVDKLLKEKVRAVMVIGQAALRMKEAWSGVVPVYSANDLDEAVKKSSALAQADDVVLLSPACSSFDMFRDYEQRGNRFKEIVRQISVTQDTHLVE
ncbi:UDP-N-acetylmuramoyl-L-alanine--D-glutamate ligase, partial [Candidatus Saccharibacteria bacterium]|nr:UDP-N-acetylmuramoyl-L-alanine--D-glutamate ligase [Candidatus Saccharibacteria bacterium]NIV03586.1 UDP-N-acetylmuramoyl-L-alanine--D-glutamate ligase [Calditrichia bacterium]NIV71874.1 UDP-N-acetylmuramoyl-L-alanine--D-glutamate ligase [Calditrichia bacterium]NIV98618.1 UDP-N-acetylmuramoyl-L-alanine--D-glutamate ligase [Candidatus Saccharibacteria bacterium]NIW78868.1 UDP-N-acetylmuramoyl-L-alanine--D-glutamate ligase [Calditrichia bacterium]